MTPRRHATILALAALAWCAASCDARRRRTPDDTIVVLIENPVNTIDPRYTVSSYDTKLSRIVAPGLVTIDTLDQSASLMLAESITQVDEKTWDVVVRADARFSDGRPVTAADVVFTYDSMIRPGSDSTYAKQFRERFTKIEAIDDRRARFHLVDALATFVTDMDQGIIAAHSPKKVIGAGAYQLVSLEPTRITLKANPHYHGPAPRVPNVDFRVVRDQSARIVMLVGGSADFAMNNVRLDLIDDVAAEERVALHAGPSSILSYVMMNNEDPILADVRVRRAIAHALDREAIIDAKFSGRAVLAAGLLPPNHWAFEPDVPRYEFDPEKARRLLDEAGYPDPPGPAPRMRLLYKTSADQFRVAIARVIAAQLGDVGIEIDLRAFEFGTFFADIKKGQYQIATMQTTDIGEPDFYRTYFNSGRIPSPKDPNAQNRWRYRNARVDELTEKGRRVVDQAARKVIYSEVQQIVAGDVPIVPLYHEDNVVLANRDLEGFPILPNARLTGLSLAAKKTD